MLGPEKWTMMQLQMKVQRLQKYCFSTSEEVQSMCAEPDLNVLHTMLNGVGGMGTGGFGFVAGGK